MSTFDQRWQRVDTQYNVAGDLIQPAPAPRLPLQRPPRAVHFTGREEELAQLMVDLQPGQVVTLCGPGGVGKTALAAEAIWTLAPGDDPPERFPGGIFFHSFYTQPQAALALEAIARAYGEEPRPSPRDAAQRVLAGRRALLVLDGAENADDLPAVLDVAGDCGVLVATRRRTDAPAEFCDLKPLPLPEAVELLQAWGGPRASDQTAVQRICELVGGLPLAVRLAGRYLAQREEDAPDYLAWLEETPLVALDLGERQNESIPLLLERSLAQVSNAGRDVLAVLGTLALAPFSRRAVATGLELSVNQLRLPLGELVSYGLLSKRGNYYELSHALIHAYIEQCCPGSPGITERLAGYYTALVKEKSKLGGEGISLLDAEWPHMATIVTRCFNQEQWETICELTDSLLNYLFLRGYSTDRILVLEAGVAAAHELVYRSQEGTFLGHLGLTYSVLGQRERAIEYYWQALAIAREVGDQRNEVIWLANLGSQYHALGNVEEAVQCFDQVLAMAREIGDRREEGVGLGNLGLIHASHGQMEKAIDYYEQALNIAREVRDRINEGFWLNALGSGYYRLGQMEQAITCCRNALAIAQEVGDRRGEGMALRNLGQAYRDMGQMKQAQKCLAQALIVFEGMRSPYAGHIRNQLVELEGS